MTDTPAADDLIPAREDSSPAAPVASRWRRNENFVLGAGAVILFLIFWEASVAFG